VAFGVSGGCAAGVGVATFARACRWAGRWTEYVTLRDAAGASSQRFSFEYVCNDRPSPVIEDFFGCPGTDLHPTVPDLLTGQIGSACNSNHLPSLEPNDHLVCSLEVVSGSGQAMRLRLVRGNGEILLETPSGYSLPEGRSYWWISLVMSPAIPEGTYACQAIVDGRLAAGRAIVVQ
jgi:hypothetical protein